MTSDITPNPSDPTPTPDSRSRADAPAPRPGLSADDLITLNEEIAGLARAGLPLDQGLAALAREMGRGRLQQVTAEIAADLKAGQTLPQALERQRGRVPPFYAGLVTTGVRTGRIAEVLATLTLYARTLTELRTSVVSALIYPLVVLTLAMALFWVLFAVLIPQFEEIYLSFRLQLPWLTQGVLEVSRRPFLYLIAPFLTLLIAILLFRFGLRGSRWGREMWTHLVYALPIVGGMIRAARLAAFTELLGILIDHKVPLGEAFALAGQACSDPLMVEASADLQADLAQGRPLGEALRARQAVPEVVAWMTSVGEQRGDLGTTLHQVAAMYRRQVELRSALLRNLLPPVLIVSVAGVLVGLFIVGIMLPLFALLRGLV